MQYLDYKNKQAIKLTQHALLLSACLLLWFHPATRTFCQYLDKQTFLVLNGTLQYSKLWQYFWGYLNHPFESWLNVLVMAVINLFGIFSLNTQERASATIDILYFWLFFQIIILVTHGIFVDLLHIQRISPSLIITPIVQLKDALHISTLKVSSTNCFPAGHALIAIYWCAFSRKYASPFIKKIIYLGAICLTMPRLFSGAHWASDVVFTMNYALLWFTLAQSQPLYSTMTKYLTKFICLVGIKQQKVTQST